MDRCKKIVSRSLLVLLCASLAFVLIPKRSYAIYGLADISFDTVQDIEGGLTTVTTGVTAGSSLYQSGLSTSQWIAKFILDPLATAMARQMIRQFSAQTVNWINSGFKGNPAYVTNPDQFFLDAGDQAVSTLLSTNSALNQLCSPFQAQVKLALVKNYLNDTQGNYSCTIDKVVKNYNNFVNNFNDGGWEGWASISQNSQNNPYGAYVNAQNQLSISLGTQQNKYAKQLDWGGGFLSFQKCTARLGNTQIHSGAKNAVQGTKKTVCDKQAPLKIGDPNSGKCLSSHEVTIDSNGNEIPSSSQASGAADTEDNPDAQACIQSETVTPGSLISDQMKNVLKSPQTQLELTNGINQIVSALMMQMVNQVVGGIGKGLRGLSQSGSSSSGSSSGSRPLLEQMMQGSPETQTEDTQTEQEISQNKDTLKPSADSTKLNLPSRQQIKSQQEAEARGDAAAYEIGTGTTGSSNTGGNNTQYDQCVSMVNQQFPSLTQEDLNQRIQSECGTQTQ